VAISNGPYMMEVAMWQYRVRIYGDKMNELYVSRGVLM